MSHSWERTLNVLQNHYLYVIFRSNVTATLRSICLLWISSILFYHKSVISSKPVYVSWLVPVWNTEGTLKIRKEIKHSHSQSSCLHKWLLCLVDCSVGWSNCFLWIKFFYFPIFPFALSFCSFVQKIRDCYRDVVKRKEK